MGDGALTFPHPLFPTKAPDPLGKFSPNYTVGAAEPPLTLFWAPLIPGAELRTFSPSRIALVLNFDAMVSVENTQTNIALFMGSMKTSESAVFRGGFIRAVL